MRAVILAFLVAAGILLPRSAAAQPGSVDVAAGYAFLRDNDLDESLPRGWFASVGAGVTNWLAVAGEVSGNYKTFEIPAGLPIEGDAKISIHFFGVGPRFVGRSGRVRPFGEVLVGAIRGKATLLGFDEAGTEFAWQPTGGVDWDLTRTVGLRVGAGGRFIQVDGDSFNEFRFIAGVVFGRRR